MTMLSAAPPPARAIVGGSDAPDRGYEAVANVDIAGLFACTGTLIAPDWVVSAGHCGSVTGGTEVGTPFGWPPGAIRVTLGTVEANGSGGETITVAEVIPSPDYLATQGNDAALLRLASPSRQVPVLIAGAGGEPLWAPGVAQTIAGFGDTEESGSPPARLQVAQVPRVADPTCAAAYPDSYETRTQLCAGYEQGGTDTCQGDSGGPLFGRDAAGVLKLTGVTSYGDGCARPGRYGVYARIGDVALREWVRSRVPGAIDDRVDAGSPAPAPPAAGTPPPAPPASAGVKLTVSRASRRALRRHGVGFRLSCPAACTARLQLRSRSRVVGRLTVRLPAAGRVSRRIRLSAKVARSAPLTLVARVGSVKLTRRVPLRR